jgi:hypothetical protein
MRTDEKTTSQNITTSFKLLTNSYHRTEKYSLREGEKKIELKNHNDRLETLDGGNPRGKILIVGQSRATSFSDMLRGKASTSTTSLQLKEDNQRTGRRTVGPDQLLKKDSWAKIFLLTSVEIATFQRYSAQNTVWLHPVH